MVWLVLWLDPSGANDDVQAHQEGEVDPCRFCDSLSGDDAAGAAKSIRRMLYEEGNHVCSRCGTIASRGIDSGAEWRIFGWEPGQAKSMDRMRCAPASFSVIQSMAPDILREHPLVEQGKEAASAGADAAALEKRTKNAMKKHAVAVEYTSQPLGCHIHTRSIYNNKSRSIKNNINNTANADANAANPQAEDGQNLTKIINRYQSWNSSSHRQRSLHSVFESLTLDATHHGLPQCILDEAKTLYVRMVTAVQDLKGEMRSAIIGASVYMACKRSGAPRSFQEVSEMCNIRQAAVSKGYRIFQQFVEDDVSTSRAEDFIGRFCSRLEMNQEFVKRVRRVLADFTDNEHPIVDSLTPPTLIAGIIRFVSEQHPELIRTPLSRAAVADACKVALATVNKSYNLVKNALPPP